MYDPSNAEKWWPAPLVNNNLPPICWGRFPYEGPPYLKSPWDFKERPCLVLAIDEAVDLPTGRFQLIVAYGTSNASGHFDGEFFVTPDKDKTGFARSGLTQPTRFNLNQLVPLYYNSDWFDIPSFKRALKSPQIGYLDTTFLPDLKTAMKEADVQRQIKNFVGLAPR